MSDPYRLEQEHLHYHDTVVRTMHYSCGFALIYSLDGYDSEEYARWRLCKWREGSGWIDDEVAHGDFEFEPHYPAVGYYDVPSKGTIYYTRSACKQWQESYSNQSRHTILKPMLSPLFWRPDRLSDVTDPEIIKALFYPKYDPVEVAYEDLRHSKVKLAYHTGRSISPNFALNLVYPNCPPVVMHHELPIGIMDDNLVVTLPPQLAELQELVAEELEVKVA